MSEKNLYCLILAGGKGTRLWPLSRELFPKQFLKPDGENSLVGLALGRAASLVAEENIFVALEERQRPLLEPELSAAGLSRKTGVVAEPVGRNTAPAILLGALEITSRDEDAVIAVFPSDHFVGDGAVFPDHVKRAAAVAREGRIATFGISPTRPETGYGYMEGGEELGGGALSIKRFVEKPDPETAEKYLRSGNFFWNSGMFVFRADVAIDEYKALCPDVYEPLAEAFGGKTLEDAYEKIPSVSFDYAVMEKTSRGAVLPSSFSWSDLGSWKLFHEFFPKDSAVNALSGDVVAKDTKNSLVKSSSRLVCVNGLRDVAVVETEDAVFVSNLDSSHRAGEIASELKGEGRREAVRPRVEDHPWGRVEEIEEGEFFTVRKTTVFPGKSRRLSDDSFRSRTLAVVRGKALVEFGRDSREVGAGENLFLEDGRECLVRNTDKGVLVFFDLLFRG